MLENIHELQRASETILK